MNYSAVAKVYRIIEYVAFGVLLQRVREWCLDFSECAGKVLIVGDGDGRFLEALLEKYPNVEVDYLEPSAGMMEQARARVGNEYSVNWISEELEEWGGASEYDMVVAHYVLNAMEPSFREGFQRALVRQTKVGGLVAVSDFSAPSTWVDSVLHCLMQCFFKLAIGQPCWSTERDDSAFRLSDCTLVQEKLWRGGWLYSQIWKI